MTQAGTQAGTQRHLIVPGVQRCGTTYLHRLLDDHPQIAMARPSSPEPKVFSDPERAARGREWYLDTFFAEARRDPGVRLLGDKSTSYLESAETAQRVRRVLGDPLIVVQLRDPVERAVSHWGLSRKHGLEERPLVDALEANLEGPLPWDPARTSVSPYAYLERGHYIDYLQPWVDVFGPDLRVVLLEEIRDDAAAREELYEWLGVDPGLAPPPSADRVNAGTVATEPLPADLAARLREHFAPADDRLVTLLGRALPWRES